MITLTRRSAPAWEEGPLTWNYARMGDGRLSATIVCGFGHFGSISDHAIADDGTVTPSVVCPEDGCSWHEHIRLDGWDPNHK